MLYGYVSFREGTWQGIWKGSGLQILLLHLFHDLLCSLATNPTKKNDHPDMQRMLGIFRAVFAMRNKQEKKQILNILN